MGETVSLAGSMPSSANALSTHRGYTQRRRDAVIWRTSAEANDGSIHNNSVVSAAGQLFCDSASRKVSVASFDYR